MQKTNSSLNFKGIFIFWLPLAATWLMMSTEGPFVAAIIARLPEPKFNLAAHGVAYSFALLMEAPIIMIMSASTALVKDRDSLIKLRKFTYTMNGAITLIMAVFLTPPPFNFVTQTIIGLPENVAQLTHYACILLLPWPSAIGYRRYYQGILIRSNLTRRVAYGTVVRLTAMVSISLFFYFVFPIHGAIVGAAALSTGVIAEATASRMMARSSVRRLLHKSPQQSGRALLSYRFITNFYFPLALTSILALGIRPLVTFFLGNSRMAIESLAALPVVYSLVFIFRSMGLSFQEVGIALLGEQNQNYRPLKNFSIFLGFFVTFGLFLFTFTPLSHVWFHQISGLSLELTEFAIFPAQLMVLLPGLTVLLSFQRSLLVTNKKTKPITLATFIEVAGVTSLLLLTLKGFNMIGLIAAAIALVLGRLISNTYLFRPFFKTLKRNSPSSPGSSEGSPT
ncbi:hypothetical protein KGY73_00255 [bacterium]|nr:hypothetical protein [bacterium]